MLNSYEQNKSKDFKVVSKLQKKLEGMDKDLGKKLKKLNKTNLMLAALDDSTIENLSKLLIKIKDKILEIKDKIENK